ncbi:MAG: Ada metal-binding domain-containing protein [Lachnospiraceae bacterium]|nr:Ada metal-binding domain-containing protein [Lachnospiraceae bacterium]
MDTISKQYKLIDSDGKTYYSSAPGLLGGHRKLKIYGRLDCPSALRYIEKGQYVNHRVFFKDEKTAIAAGYRPCAICMPDEYRRWKAEQGK